MQPIYEVYANIVDANGTPNALSGYPKRFKSDTYGSAENALERALADFCEVEAAMHKHAAQSGTRIIQEAFVRQMGTAQNLRAFTKSSNPTEPELEPEPEQEA